MATFPLGTAQVQVDLDDRELLASLEEIESHVLLAVQELERLGTTPPTSPLQRQAFLDAEAHWESLEGLALNYLEFFEDLQRDGTIDDHTADLEEARAMLWNLRDAAIDYSEVVDQLEAPDIVEEIQRNPKWHDLAPWVANHTYDPAALAAAQQRATAATLPGFEAEFAKSAAAISSDLESALKLAGFNSAAALVENFNNAYQTISGLFGRLSGLGSDLLAKFSGLSGIAKGAAAAAGAAALTAAAYAAGRGMIALVDPESRYTTEDTKRRFPGAGQGGAPGPGAPTDVPDDHFIEDWQIGSSAPPRRSTALAPATASPAHPAAPTIRPAPVLLDGRQIAEVVFERAPDTAHTEGW